MRGGLCIPLELLDESSRLSFARHIASSRQLSLTPQAAELLGTSERFPRRLIAERRIRFVRIGRHIRIPETALREFIAAGVVEPLTVADVRPAPWRAA